MATEPLPATVREILSDSTNIRARYPSHLAHQWRRSQIQSPSNSNFIARLLPRSRTTVNQDTAAACLYRIYTFFVLHDTVAFRNELEYFCRSHPEWAVSSLPDPSASDDGPGSSDPSNDEQVRYTILAVLTRLMCDAFNRRIDLGLPRDAPAIIEDFEELQARPKVHESPPEWATQVQPLHEKVFIPNSEGKVLGEDDEDVNKEFKDMNIIVQMPHIHFI
ncbi:hypothetical protein CC1G_13863 [Coprinopsis cinerea okayama7|uniref:Uncharacterized protein n=1 Tax=Coprinopsis cinerea (strain Okayama-7 / 130 / ATCC MYA-4618 / FGSC 9003) TaxID=240176 RepID=D6RKW5_COPC7|nr:hypothetical protein CC1G_13863 [Coprinopsis cinerea okayama7\|eukprot:XP_002911828.1 hypothetical protein CC1G_13863 [Coprinopsis cinerea okayama7\